MNIRSELEKRISAAITAAAGAAQPLPAIVAPSAKAEFGDYQANGVMAAAKAAKMNPRALAGEVLKRLDVSDLAEKMEIAGPGFLNITLRTDLLAQLATQAADDPRLGVAPAKEPQKIVVDYSAPNLAKEMHVGHLRSTIIGDSLVRVLDFLGHHVIRQNHVGDWGTQFGMLLAHMDDIAADAVDTELSDLEDFYRQAKKRFDENADFADKARQYVVRLQGGDKNCRRAWEKFLEISLGHCEQVYARLGVLLTRGDVRGESSYNDDLPAVVEDLRQKGMLKESQGALCVFLDQFKGEDGEPLPMIVQKTGGGYLYATTDLAALRYRVNVLHSDRILYVIDHRQSLHLQQLFAVARAAGFAPPQLQLEHVAFGTMLGEDGRPFRTRAGGTVKLIELLDEAESRAMDVVRAKTPEIEQDVAARIAHVVGTGAMKYADLSMDRISDYKFSFDKMLSLAGNTAPYMQYAYARVRSIFRKGSEDASAIAPVPIALGEPAERELAKKLLRLEEILESVAVECKPNILTAYLYDVAGAFTTFYENCPVLKAAPDVRASRLRLCDLTARTIEVGLGLLGIEVVEQM